MKTKTSSGGIGFSSLLQLCFIVLKLCNVISWSWFWVLSPTWIGVCVAILFIIIIVLLNK